MATEFKLHEKCAKCTLYSKKCKGYEFSIRVENLSCKKFKGEKANEKK